MSIDLFFGLVVFAAISAYTPGPNNTLLMASGLNYGFRRTVPMIFGIGIGFPLMIGCVGFGLGRVLETWPHIYFVLKYAGAVYMLWLAFKIATAKPSDTVNTPDGKPLTFLQTAAFQWINPKGWFMAVTSLSAYTVASSYVTGVAAVVATFVVMGFSSAATWALFGVGLKGLMADARWFRTINFALALLLVGSLLPMLLH